jgi:preprotein translocase subunit SecY
VRKLYNKVVRVILVFILIFLYVHVQFSAAEIAHQLESAEECNKLTVKKTVLDAGLQEYDTFVRSLFIVILIFTLFHLIIFCIIHIVLT